MRKVKVGVAHANVLPQCNMATRATACIGAVHCRHARLDHVNHAKQRLDLFRWWQWLQTTSSTLLYILLVGHALADIFLLPEAELRDGFLLDSHRHVLGSKGLHHGDLVEDCGQSTIVLRVAAPRASV